MRTHTAESKAKMSAAKKGKPRSKETREKMRAAALRRWAKVREARATLGISN